MTVEKLLEMILHPDVSLDDEVILEVREWNTGDPDATYNHPAACVIVGNNALVIIGDGVRMRPWEAS